jgi:predicted ATPase
MLTRLRIKGFKNLADVELYFGPFTCVAGANAVGKSNLFDAIRFLSSVADSSLLESAMAVRDEATKSNDVRSLLYTTKVGQADTMSFEADMIIPQAGLDDLGQPAEASVSFLSYNLEIAYRAQSDVARAGLELVRESLHYIKVTEAKKFLPFGPSPRWIRSVIKGRRTSPFISTDGEPGSATVRLHQEGRQGRTREFRASTLPRTVLSTVNATESPTALLARREMQSWRLLQLEPSALRAPDSFTAPAVLGANGLHLPATLNRLTDSSESNVYPDPGAAISNRLAELVPEIRSVRVDRDKIRQLLTVNAEMKDGTVHAARSLSDGTLRFLALAVLEADSVATGLLCFEEPENGIHPERVPAMLSLLNDLCVDTQEPTGPDNPLRQVIVSTHSPLIVAQVPDDSIVFARRVGEGREPSVGFSPLDRTWRSKAQPTVTSASKGIVLRFLQPILAVEDSIRVFDDSARVMDRPEYQPSLPFLNRT